MINPGATRNPDGSWSFTWPASTPPYSIWLDGVVLDEVDVEAFTFSDHKYVSAPPAIEVVDAVSSAQSQLYPPRVTIQWRGSKEAAGYVIEQWNGSSWVEQVAYNESGRGEYMSWTSFAQADGSTPQLRVRARDLRGNLGAPLVPIKITIARNPAPPAVSYAITAGAVVVS